MRFGKPRETGGGSGFRAVAADWSALAVWAIVLMLPSLTGGLPIGHDYPVHVNYMAAVADQMAAGEPYPRWLSGLWDGAGGPDLFFYPPLIYWAGGILRMTACAQCGGADLFVLTGIFWQFLFGAGIRSLALRHAGRPAALAGAAIAMALPYHLGADWSDRSAYAEFAAAALIPWHVAAFLDCLAGRSSGLRLAVLTALVMLCHMVTGLMLAFTYPALVVALGRLRDWRALGRLTLAAATGAGLSAVYWYPAIALMGSVNAAGMDRGFTDPAAWLFWPRHLVMGDGFLAGLWAPFFGMTAICAIVLILTRRGASGLWRIAATLIGVTLVMLSPAAWPLYEYTPLGRIQFPWRFLVIADIGFALTVCIAAGKLGGMRANPAHGALAAACLAAAAYISAGEYPGFRDSRNVHRFVQAAFMDRSLPFGHRSWLPVEASAEIRSDSRTEGIMFVERIAGTPFARIDSGPPGGTVTLVAQAPRRLLIEADLAAPSRVVLRRTYWRHARLRDEAGGAEVPLEVTPDFPLTAATLPAGHRRYVMELPMLPPERKGLILSLASLLFAAAWLVRGRRRQAPVPTGQVTPTPPPPQ